MKLHQQLSKVAQQYLELETEQVHTRCSGCGNYGILNALMSAIALEWYEGHQVILANDVGCSGNVSDKIEINTIHGLHGRVLPLASGIHCANPEIPVFAMAGDGATLSEGVNHLIHTARNNYNITFLLHNNHNYGLTTGQASATTPQWYKMKGTAGETTAHPLVPAQLVLAAGGSFVARGYSGNVEQLVWLIRQGMQHQGFSFIEVMQLCPTYSKATPGDWYEERIYEVGSEHDISDKWKASQLVENFDRIATGVIYQDSSNPDFMSLQTYRSQMASTPVAETQQVDISSLLQSLTV